MKAVLVINEMPAECIECQFCRVYADNKPTETRCILTAKRNEDGVNTRAEWCPLRPLPSKRHIPFTKTFGTPFNVGKAKGWNACLDAITGEKDESNIGD